MAWRRGPAAPSVAFPAVLIGVAIAACGAQPPRELQRVRSGDVDVVLLSPDVTLQHGHDSLVLEFRSASGGTLVDPGNVRANAAMPMPGAPMFGSVDAKKTATPGRYEVSAALEMAGTWRLTVEWGSPARSVTFSQRVD